MRCSVENVVKRNDYALANDISLLPLLRLDFKEGRVRITCTQDSYSVTISRQFFGLVPRKNHQHVTWKIRNYYPLVNESTAYVTKKKVTSKAFVMAYLSAIHYIIVLEDYLLQFSAFYQIGYMCA